MALSEIEKLERRYAENPQGLTFAPLAEVHRKNGEVQRALDLLGPGLALHPNYIPASIVLGRCHLDLGDVHAAEKAFLHVLSLDGENVIALKALADISERLVKFDDAERWLNTLLSVDRSNDEAREQLQRVEIARRQAGVASAAEPDSLLEPDVAAEAAGETAHASTEPAPAAADAGPETPPAFEPPIAEPAVGWVSQSNQASEPSFPPLEDLEPSAFRGSFDEAHDLRLEEPTRYEEHVEPLDGLVGREVDEPDETADGFRVETSEDIVLRSAGGGEFQVPDASQELFAERSQGERAPFDDPPVPAPEVVGEAVPVDEPEPEPISLVSEPEPEPVPHLLREPEAEPEPESAAAEPAPAEFASESQPEVVPIDHFPIPASAAADEPVPPPAPKRAYAAGETGGLPLAHFLKGILAARPPAHSAAPPVRQAPAASGSGAPTRPAADALSLSSVFGEEAPSTPPAVPAAGGAGVSFDDFFGAPGAAPAQRNARAQDPKNDDLDQFHAWLQNLKR